MAEHPLHQLVLLTRRLRDRLITRDFADSRDGRGVRELFAERTGLTTFVECADAVALATASALLAVQRVLPTSLPGAARQWLLAQADPLILAPLAPCLDASRDPASGMLDELTEIRDYLATPATRLADYLSATNVRSGWEGLYFLETFLQQYHAPSRRKRGVYYTPVELATFLVRQVDECLRNELGCSRGLVDAATWQSVASRPEWVAPQSSFVRTLDPAMGTGVFLLAAFDRMRSSWTTASAGLEHESAAHRAWSPFVNSVILPRLVGQDLMLSAVVVAQLLLTARLVYSGYDFRPAGVLELHCGNTLLHPRVGDEELATSDTPFTVIWGNPPFSGLSEHRSPWIRDLLRGQAPGTPGAVANYFEVDGRPLAERKHWLDDDYVKFLRVAHWLVERAGCGVVGLVSNHGYLDNVTFRGLRQQLLKAFSRVSVLDLHGNSRAGERAPQGDADESVFGIEQGVAVSLLCRPPACDVKMRDAAVRVEHVQLWGGRQDKLARLAQHELPTPVALEPRTPHYLFVPRDVHAESLYLRGVRLCDVMPLSSTAPVTARDGLVVAFTADELRTRLRTLADPRIADDTIREQYFPRPRSNRYPAGDTRGWQLPEARARLREELDWGALMRPCQYRPFDRRWIIWAKWMIDWRRETVVRHLTGIPNLALVARRQSPAAQPCDYFWITDMLALDGLIRSDNRGSESLFPLYVMSPEFPSHDTADAHSHHVTANFARDFVQQMERQLGRAWCETTDDTVDGCSFTPLALFNYIYALFHAPSYRQRFASWLRQDFPRVFLPAHAELFDPLQQLGDRLVRLHRLREPPSHGPTFEAEVGDLLLKAPYPRWSPAERIELAPAVSCGPVQRGTWEYRVGAYQVCQKWLKDRPGRLLTTGDLRVYTQLVAAIEETRQIAQQIDTHIQLAGDWPQAFA